MRNQSFEILFPTIAFLTLAIFGLGAPCLGATIEELQAGVVKIEAKTAEAGRKIGTGFILELKEGEAYILTAYHVIAGAQKPSIYFHTKPDAPFAGKPLFQDAADDRKGLAILRVQGQLPEGLRILNLNTTLDLKGKDELIIFSFAHKGRTSFFFRAHIAGRFGAEMAIDSNVEEGTSGGPLLFGDQVVGVITSVDGIAAFATPASIIKYIADSERIFQPNGVGRPIKKKGYANIESKMLALEEKVKRLEAELKSENELSQEKDARIVRLEARFGALQQEKEILVASLQRKGRSAQKDQSIPSIQWLGKKPETEKPLEDENGDLIQGAVIVDDATFLTAPQGSGTALPKTPLFLDSVLAYRVDPSRDWYLVHNERVGWGWMPETDLLMRKQSLSVADLRRESSATLNQRPGQSNALQVGDDAVLIKLIAKKDPGNLKLQEKISILAGPNETAKKVYQAKIFKKLYPYKFFLGKDGETYAFVANSSVWNIDEPSSDLLGWINVKQTLRWASNLAVYYNLETKGERPLVEIFPTRKDLIAYRNDSTVGQRNGGGFFAREPEYVEPLEFYDSRYPVLNEARLSDGTSIMKIAWTPSGQKEAPRFISNRDGKSKTKLQRELIESARHRDVLILLDDTVAMGPTFDHVRDAIWQFIKSLRGSDRMNYRFAFARYGAYASLTERKEFKLLQDFSDADGVRNWDVGLGSDYPLPLPGEPSAFFNGIIQSIKSVSWGSGSSRALIVVGSEANPIPDPQGLTESEVISTMNKHRVLFYPVNLKFPLKHAGYNLSFQRQIKTILSGIGNRGTIINVGNTTTPFSTAKDQIILALQKIHSFTDLVLSAIKKVFYEKRMEVENEYGTVKTRYILDTMKEKGLTWKNSQLEIPQGVREGWVLRKSPNGKDNFKDWLLVERTEIFDMLTFLSALSSANKRTHSGKNLKHEVVNIVRRISGDEIQEDERVSDYMARHFHIPYKHFSHVLQNSPENLQKKFQNAKSFREELRETLCLSTAKLGFVVAEQGGEQKYEDGKCTTISKGVKKWWWTSESGNKFVWLPSEYLP